MVATLRAPLCNRRPHQRAGLEAPIRCGGRARAYMASKSGVRTLVTLVCNECKAYTYHTQKNRRNDPDRIELTKFCPTCRCRRGFREKR